MSSPVQAVVCPPGSCFLLTGGDSSERHWLSLEEMPTGSQGWRAGNPALPSGCQLSVAGFTPTHTELLQVASALHLTLFLVIIIILAKRKTGMCFQPVPAGSMRKPHLSIPVCFH